MIRDGSDRCHPERHKIGFHLLFTKTPLHSSPSRYNLNTIRLYPALIVDNLHAGIDCLLESSPEFGVCLIIGQDLSNPIHLDHEGY